MTSPGSQRKYVTQRTYKIKYYKPASMQQTLSWHFSPVLQSGPFPKTEQRIITHTLFIFSPQTLSKNQTQK